MENFFLSILSLIILINAIMIIISKNPIHSILFLVLVFVSTTGLLILLGVEFIAMLFLVVYVGAITVLFLFVIMMLNVKIIELNERFIQYLPIGLFIGLIFLLEVLFLLNNNLISPNINLTEVYINNITTTLLNNYFIQSNDYFQVISLTNIEQIGNFLFNEYAYLFFLGGVILFLAMIGAIILTLNQKLKNKKQDYYTQTNRLLHESIRHLK
jgi:NADH:ubiquinone oxidoreductase subunit 6 (subunit J)